MEIQEIDPFDPRVDKRKLQYASVIQEPKHSLMFLISLIAFCECSVKVLVGLSLIEQEAEVEKSAFKWSASTAIGVFTLLSLVISMYLFSFPGGKDKLREDIPCSHRITTVTFIQSFFNIATKIISSLLMTQSPTMNPIVKGLNSIRPFCPVILLTTIFFCDGLFLLIHENCEVSGYNPFSNSKNYEKLEISEENDGNIALISSGAFRIVLRNISSFSWLEPQIQIYRHTSDTSGRHKDYRSVQFTLSLEREVPPGEELVLVPEPIYEEGAVEVPGYRGFGPEKAEQIFTTIKLPGVEEVLAKLSEKYRKKKFGRRLED